MKNIIGLIIGIVCTVLAFSGEIHISNVLCGFAGGLNLSWFVAYNILVYESKRTQ